MDYTSDASPQPILTWNIYGNWLRIQFAKGVVVITYYVFFPLSIGNLD